MCIRNHWKQKNPPSLSPINFLRSIPSAVGFLLLHNDVEEIPPSAGKSLKKLKSLFLFSICFGASSSRDIGGTFEEVNDRVNTGSKLPAWIFDGRVVIRLKMS